jgi:hypothetical protein
MGYGKKNIRTKGRNQRRIKINKSKSEEKKQKKCK